MNATPLGEIVLWFRDAHVNIVQLAESLSDDQLRWQPHPQANSIAFQLWHLARSADYIQARLSDATLELGKRLGARQQLWLAENYASKWEFDSSTLGIEEMGWEMTPDAAAHLRFPSKDALLNYVRRSFEIEEQTLDALDDEQYQAFRLHDWASNQTVGNFLMSYFVHEREHFGVMQYMQGLQHLLEETS